MSMRGRGGGPAGLDRKLNANEKKDLIRILGEAKPYVKLMLLSGLFIIIATGADLSKTYIVKTVLDDFLYENQVQQGLHSIWGLAILYLAAVVIGGGLQYLQTNIMNSVGQSVIMNLRRKVFSYIQMMPLTALDKISAGRLITRATNDVEALSELFTNVIVMLFKDIFTLVGIVAMMVYISPKLALASCIGIPVIALITVITRNILRKNWIKVKSLIGQINGFFAENISGMRIVQMFVRERDKMREFKELNDDYFKHSMVQIRVNSMLRPLMEVVNAVVTSVLIWIAFGDIANGWLLPGVLYAFTTYVKQFFEPINNLAEMYSTIQSAAVSANRIYELMDNQAAQEDLETGDHVDRFEGRIEFKNVWFAYNDENWVLKDVSFTIEPGQRIAFVGTTGSGKTTIISLLTRFYEIQKGQILVDGKDIKTINLKDLRRNIAVVLQDVFLFAGTIEDNISLEDHMDECQIEKAIEMAHADNFVRSLSGGIHHPVMERGSSFSAGQRQLISFARAIVHDPRVFVLDEATANIDTETEQMIQASLNDVARDRTVVIIAHRLSTIRSCDCIFVMSHGVIEERGTHDELIALGGRYFKLHEAQSKEKDEAISA